MISRSTRAAASLALTALAVAGVRTAAATGAGQDQGVLVGGGPAGGCTSSAVEVRYDVDYDPATRGFAVSAAQLSGLDEACHGHDAVVQLSGRDGVALAELRAVVDGVELTVPVPAATPVPADAVAGVSVVLLAAGV